MRFAPRLMEEKPSDCIKSVRGGGRVGRKSDYGVMVDTHGCCEPCDYCYYGNTARVNCLLCVCRINIEWPCLLRREVVFERDEKKKFMCR